MGKFIQVEMPARPEIENVTMPSRTLTADMPARTFIVELPEIDLIDVAGVFDVGQFGVATFG